MFSSSEFERINDEFKQIQKQKKQKLQKGWSIFLLLTIILIIGFIVIFPKQFNSGETAWILPTYGGMLLLTTILGLLISSNSVSVKPYYTFLYDEIYNKINMHEGMSLNYKSYDKEARGFNKVGGLFTRGASVNVKRHIEGDSADHHHFNIYECSLVTSNGKNSQTHFNGVYFVLNKSINTSLQIRTNGSPKLKGVKFDKQDEFEDIRVYKEKDQSMLNIDYLFVTYMNKLAMNEEYKKVFLSIVDGQIHLGIWYKNIPTKKQKNLTIESYNKLAAYFISEYQLLTELAGIDNY